MSFVPTGYINHMQDVVTSEWKGTCRFDSAPTGKPLRLRITSLFLVPFDLAATIESRIT
jgi:hypothetical protein